LKKPDGLAVGLFFRATFNSSSRFLRGRRWRASTKRVAEANNRFYEFAPGHNYFIGINAEFNF